MKINKRKLITSLTMVMLTSLTQADDFTPYMPIKGSFSVDGKGASKYSIPIDIVPAKFSPHLSLSYNSQSGGSYVGAGWSLNGSPALRMCSLNKRQDNKWSNIMLNMGADNYTVNRFCMGGSRLSVIKGNYGDDGSEYQTELMGKYRITAKGNCGDGPCSFEVKNAVGTVATYGGTPNTTVQLEDKDILIWGMNTHTDKYGNLIQYSYAPSDGTNVLYPTEIGYFFNADKSDSRKVLFSYNKMTETNRQSKRIGLGGYAFKPDKVLAKISTQDTKGVGVLSYDMTYNYDKFSNSYSLIKLSKSSADETKTYLDHTFGYKDYQPSTPDFVSNGTVTMPPNGTEWDGIKVVIMDKYGDGYNGVGIISNESNKAVFSFARGDADGKLTLAEDRMELGRYSPTDKSEDAYTFMAFDKNGDGLNDLIKIFKGNDGNAYAKTFLSSAGKPNFDADPVIQPLGNAYVDTGKMRVTYTGRDINGDGLHDIIVMAPQTDQPTSKYNIVVHYASVKGGFPTQDEINGQIQNSVVPTVDQSINFADYDKDTLSDFFLLKKGTGTVLATPLYNREGKFLAPDGKKATDISLGAIGDWKDLPAYKFLDFNNDGLSDLVKFNYSKTQPVTGNIYMNTGNLFGDMLHGSGVGDNTTQVFTLTDAGEDESSAHDTTFVDINGDGQPDIMKYRGGQGDPKDPDKTYFDTFLHTGNTFQKSKSTIPFGARTRNVVSSMGDNPLASIVSVQQVSGEVNVSVYMNSVTPPQQELVSIDNGAGLVYDIDYEKLSPFVDYENIQLPSYPNILLSKVRVVVSVYSESKNKDKSYGYSVDHALKYMFPIYNRHDWMFSGYAKVKESIKSLDKIITSTYSNEYPTRGKLLSKTVGQLSTGIPFNKTENIYASIERYSNVEPAVSMVYKSRTLTTTYQDSDSANDSPVAYSKQSDYGVDTDWGIPLWSSSQFVGGEPLFKCYRFSVNDADTGIFTVGDKTGTLFTTSKTQCDAFVGKKSFNAPYTRADGDMDVLLTQYSTDGLFSPIANMVYSSEHKAYATSSMAYDKKGNVIQKTVSKDYTDLTGRYPNKDNLIVTNLTFDDAGYVSKKEQAGLIELSTVDSRFGTKVSSTSANGSVTTHGINKLGSIILNKTNGIKASALEFGRDTNGIFKRTDTFIADGVSTKKTYIDGKSTAWKSTTTTNGSQLLTTGELGYDSDTGKIVARFAPYFDKTQAQVVQISYDKRWLKNKEVRGDKTNTFLHSFSLNTATVTHKGNDPTHKVKILVLLGSQYHDFIARTKTHTTADGHSSVGTYDSVGNLIKEVDYRGLVSTKAYDSNRKFVEDVTPDSGKENYTYSATGKLVKHTRGSITNDYVYDTHDRIVSRTRSDVGMKNTVDYTWDEKATGFFNTGLMTGIKNGDINNVLNYNQDGNLASKTWNLNGKHMQYFTYDYYEGGFPKTVNYPDKSSVTYNYSKTGELSSFQYKAPNATTFEQKNTVSFGNYGINRKPLLISYGQELAMTKTIDGWGRTLVDSTEHKGTKVSVVKYDWDNAGNIISKTNNGDDTTYTYDGLNRLIQAKNAKRNLIYKYDENNNLLQNGSNTFVMDTKTNRLATGVISDSPVTFSYDGDGRLLGDGEETYAYGDSGRLETITHGKTITHIKYFNQIKVSDDSAFYLDNGFEVHSNGYLKRIKAFKQSLLVVNPDGTSDYIIPDNLNSQLMTIDSATITPTSNYEYEPYGASHEIK